MHYPYPAQELTSFFEEIHHLPAGRYLEVDLGTGAIREQVYWDPAPVGDPADRGRPRREV